MSCYVLPLYAKFCIIHVSDVLYGLHMSCVPRIQEAVYKKGVIFFSVTRISKPQQFSHFTVVTERKKKGN